MNNVPPLPPLPPNVVNLPHITRPEPINDGGPAFPMGYHRDGNDADHFGMTLRDYFAAAALQGSIACVGSGGDWNDFAKDAYKYADAMLKARETSR